MGLKDELVAKVDSFAVDTWGDISNAYVVPSSDDLTFGNDGRWMEVCVLYADLCGSTKMVDELPATRSAEYYKAFLHCAARLIKETNGEVQAYDGDRVMGIFTGADRCDNAVQAAFRIQHAMLAIINPAFARIYGAAHRELRHTVGIDQGRVLVAKTGVRVDNDLVWVGPCANYAAKLNSFEGLDNAYPTRVTKEVFDVLSKEARLGGQGEPMWEGPYVNVGKRQHYRSRFYYRIPE